MSRGAAVLTSMVPEPDAALTAESFAAATRGRQGPPAAALQASLAARPMASCTFTRPDDPVVTPDGPGCAGGLRGRPGSLLLLRSGRASGTGGRLTTERSPRDRTEDRPTDVLDGAEWLHDALERPGAP